MKLRILFAALAVCISSMNGKQKIDKTYTVIQPAPEDKRNELAEWIVEENISSEWDPEYQTVDQIKDYAKTYIVDINNDGKNEYVLTMHFGSSDEIHFYVFAKDKRNKFYQLDAPQKNQPEHIYGDFHNALTSQEELFVRANGKTYLLYGYGYNSRAITIWENGVEKDCYDEFWVNQQRDYFNKLYQKKLYHDAYCFLDEFEKASRSTIDPQTNLWMRNDLALAALRDNHPNTALKLLRAIKKDGAFENASPALKKAVKTNEKLCVEAIKKETIGESKKYNYNGLLTNTQITADLISAIVPDIAPEIPGIETDGQRPYETGEQFSHYILNHFNRVTENPIKANRYVTITGSKEWMESPCGFIWCDVRKQISVAAFGKQETEWNKESPLYITSRTLDADELPDEFYSSLKNWIQTENIRAKEIYFYDRAGEKTEITLND